jgi:DNA-binding XRE family transcriptional regulator
MAAKVSLHKQDLWSLLRVARALLDDLQLDASDRQRVCEYLCGTEPPSGSADTAHAPSAWLDLHEWPGFSNIADATREIQDQKQEFAQRLRNRLASAGISQAALAHDLGISDSAVGQYLSGKHKPQARTLYRLAEVLGCRVEDLWPVS